MSITFACGQCGKPFTVDEKFAGKKGKCKQCGALMMIPAASLIIPVARTGDREISPSRRAPGAPRPPQDDVFGFDDDPRPTRSAAGVMEDEEFSPVLAPRPKQRSAGTFDPPAKKKKRRRPSGEEPAAMVFFRILLGLAIGSGGMFACLVLMGNLPNLSKLMPAFSFGTDVDAICQERIDLNRKLTMFLISIHDASSAGSASASANQQIRAMTANLRKLQKAMTTAQKFEASLRKHQFAMNDATRGIIQQFVRIAGIPNAFDALNVKDSLEELAKVEAEMGMKQDMPNAPIAPPVMPKMPRVNMNPQPGFPPQMKSALPPNLGNRNRSGGRRTPTKPGGFGP